jgi:hypothetical protein
MSAGDVWTIKLADADARILMRGLDFLIERAENAGTTQYAIDKLCRRECAVQWARIKNEIADIVGEE